MSSSSSPRLSATQVPSITQLRNQLDYGDSTLTRCGIFYDDLRIYRRKFRTQDGTAGIDLHEWKERSHQVKLDEITTAYLDRDGNGENFWPDDASAPNYNKWQYSKHRPMIQRLIKQLIFRLNQQQFRNHKYKKKSYPSTTSLSPRGTSIDNPIEVDAGYESTVAVQPEPPRDTDHNNSPERSRVVKLKLSPKHLQNQSQETLDSPSPSRQGALEDPNIYNFTGSPEPPIHRPTKKRAAGESRRDDGSLSPKIKRPKKQPRAKVVDKPSKRSNVATHTSKSPASSVRKSSGQRDRAPRPGQSDPLPSPTLRSYSNRNIGTGLDNEVLGAAYRVVAEPLPETRNDQPENTVLSTIERSGITSTNIRGNLTDQINPRDPQPGPPERRPPEALLPKTPASEHGQSYPFDTSMPMLPSESTRIIAAANTTLTEINEQTQPSGIPTAPRLDDQPKAESKAEQKAESKAKPKFKVTYLLILSRSPIYQSRSWEPQGSFQEMTLAQLLQQLPFSGDVNGLIFTFEGPGLKMKESIDSTNENAFGTMKKHLNKGIRGALVNNSGSLELLEFELEIEPRRETTIMSDDEDDEISFF